LPTPLGLSGPQGRRPAATELFHWCSAVAREDYGVPQGSGGPTHRCAALLALGLGAALAAGLALGALAARHDLPLHRLPPAASYAAAGLLWSAGSAALLRRRRPPPSPHR